MSTLGAGTCVRFFHVVLVLVEGTTVMRCTGYRCSVVGSVVDGTGFDDIVGSATEKHPGE